MSAKQAAEIVRLKKWIARLQKQIVNLKADRESWARAYERMCRQIEWGP